MLRGFENMKRFMIVSEAENGMWWMWEDKNRPNKPYFFRGIISWDGQYYMLFSDNSDSHLVYRMALKCFQLGTNIDLKKWTWN